MNTLWSNVIIIIYFIYGLAFFSLGLALLIESGRSSELALARAMRWLAGFGLLHGLHEWLDMLAQSLKLYYNEQFPLWLDWVHLSILVVSFFALVVFGQSLFALEQKNKYRHLVLVLLGFYIFSAVAVRWVYNLNELDWIRASAGFARYFLGIPGSILSCLALWQQRRIFKERGMDLFVNDLTIAAVALAFYGVVGQVVVAKSVFFPANILNAELFLDIFQFPIELVRAGVAVIVAFAMIRVLRALEVENEQRIKGMESAKHEAEQLLYHELTNFNAELQAANAEKERLLHELRQRDALRGVLLQHITAAQESERQRIARELHDETGQALTGLSMGLRGIATKLENAGKLTEAHYLNDLERTATTALGDLRLLISDLRPPQLDDMGLVAALRWLINRCKEHNHLPIQFQVHGEVTTLSPEVETTLFRIVQEGLNNIIKHAHATEAGVQLDFGADKLTLKIWDNGKGFAPEVALEPQTTRTAWGLLGMQERAALIDATLNLQSVPNNGTTLELTLQLCKAKKS